MSLITKSGCGVSTGPNYALNIFILVLIPIELIFSLRVHLILVLALWLIDYKLRNKHISLIKCLRWGCRLSALSGVQHLFLISKDRCLLYLLMLVKNYVRFLGGNLTISLIGGRRHHHGRFGFKRFTLSLELNLVGRMFSCGRYIAPIRVACAIGLSLVLGGSWLNQLKLFLVEQAGKLSLLLLPHHLFHGHVGRALISS